MWTDFNQGFARIDIGIRAAKAQAERLEQGKAGISTGAYAGDNATSRMIYLGLRLRATLVGIMPDNRYGNSDGESISGGLTVDDWLVLYQDINESCTLVIQIQAGDFAVIQDSRNRSYMNYSGTKHHYSAVKQNIPSGMAWGDVSM